MNSVLGASAQLPKTAISFVMPVHLSVRVKQLGTDWPNFLEILYLCIIRKSAEKN